MNVSCVSSAVIVRTVSRFSDLELMTDGAGLMKNRLQQWDWKKCLTERKIAKKLLFIDAQ